MRVLRLCLLAVVVYVVSMVVLFPAAPIVERIKPQLGFLQLDGVSGKLYNGSIASVRYTDDLLPLEFSHVGWTAAPATLLRGGAGVTVQFSGYGGGGNAQVTRLWNGNIAISDFIFTAEAKALEPLLPVPIAQFSGQLSGNIDSILLEKQLLTQLDGVLSWNQALLETPVRTSLGTLTFTIKPDGPKSHIATITASGGDVGVDGTISMAGNGDFAADVLLTPVANASAELIGGLQQMARPEAGGKFRLQRSGNVNKLM